MDVEKFAYARDAGAYLAFVIAVFVASAEGSWRVAGSAGLVGSYGAYLVVAILPARVTALAKFIAGDDEEDDGGAEEATRGAGVLDDDEDFDGSYAAIIEDGAGTPPRAWRGGGAGTTVANGSRLDADGVEPNPRRDGNGNQNRNRTPEPRGAFARRWARKMGAVLVAVAEMPATAVLRVTMPELGADPARQSRALVSLLPVTAPLFFATAERIFPGTLTPAGLVYGAVCGAIGAAATWCAWPTLTGRSAARVCSYHGRRAHRRRVCRLRRVARRGERRTRRARRRRRENSRRVRRRRPRHRERVGARRRRRHRQRHRRQTGTTDDGRRRVRARNPRFISPAPWGRGSSRERYPPRGGKEEPESRSRKRRSSRSRGSSDSWPRRLRRAARAHDWRVGRRAAAGMLGYYALFAAAPALVAAGVVTGKSFER